MRRIRKIQNTPFMQTFEWKISKSYEEFSILPPVKRGGKLFTPIQSHSQFGLVDNESKTICLTPKNKKNDITFYYICEATGKLSVYEIQKEDHKNLDTISSIHAYDS